jgi:predicted MFS family arabinose efflux permease
VVLARPRLRRLALAGFCLAGAQLTLSTFFAPFLVEGIGLELITAGLVFGVLQLMGVPGRVLWGWLADRGLGLERALLVLAVLTTAGLALLASAGPAWPVLAFSALAVFLGLSVMAWTGLLIAATVAAAPDAVGAASAGAMIFTFAGVVAVPPIVGLVVAATGSYATGFLLAFAIAALSVALLARRVAAAEDG